MNLKKIFSAFSNNKNTNKTDNQKITKINNSFNGVSNSEIVIGSDTSIKNKFNNIKDKNIKTDSSRCFTNITNSAIIIDGVEIFSKK